jgi:hypothetical protein
MYAVRLALAVARFFTQLLGPNHFPRLAWLKALAITQLKAMA